MFLLKCLKFVQVLTNSNSFFLKNTSKFRGFACNTCLSDSYSTVCVKNNRDCFHQKLFSCQYSSNASEAQVNQSDSSSILSQRRKKIPTDIIFAEISDGDDQVLRKLKLLEFEVEVFRQTERTVPEFIRKKEWEELLSLKSLNGRKRYLNFLFKNEKKTENLLLKKKALREEYMKLKEEGLYDDPMFYSLSGQALLLRVYNKTLHEALQLRHHIFEEMAQQIIFDCSYQEYMSELNTKFCAVQLLYSMNIHMFHPFPNIISLYNLKKTDYLYKVLPSYFTAITKENFPWKVSEGSYLDDFPKDRLVYLTPHCLEPLGTPNPDDIYIIGAFVDKGMGVKASLAKAKKNKIRMARFPLDEYVKWKQGTKSLPLNIVLKILLDKKYYKSWQIAVKNVPSRMYENYELKDLEDDDIIV